MNHAVQVQVATQNVQQREQAGRMAFQQAQQGASTLAPQDDWRGVGGGGGEGLVGSGGITPNQFDASLYSNPDPATEAAACGPAAYAALTAYLGRPATMDEAVAWAQANGWNQSGGMNGFANFEAMLAKKGLPVTASAGEPDWDRIYANAAQQIPSVVSTANHYFVIEGLGPNGTFDTEGAYGAGREYLTADQIRSLGGGINGSVVMNQGVQRGPMTMAENQTAPTAQEFAGLPDLTGGAGSAAAPAGTSGRYATDTNGRPIIMADGRGDKYIQLADGTWEPYGAPKPVTAAQTGGAVLSPGQIAVGPNGNILASNPNPAARDQLAQAQLNYQAALAQIQRQWQADRDTAAYNQAKLKLDTWIENEKAKLGRMSLEASSALKDRELAQPIAGAQGAMWWPGGVLGSAFSGEYGMNAGTPDAAPTWEDVGPPTTESPAAVAANAAPTTPPATGLPGSPAVPVATNAAPPKAQMPPTSQQQNGGGYQTGPITFGGSGYAPYNSGNVDQDYPGGTWPDAQPIYSPAPVTMRPDVQNLENSPVGQAASAIGNAVGSLGSMRDPVKDAWNGLTSGLASDVSAWAQREMAKREQQMHPYNSGNVDQEVPGMPDMPWPDNRTGSGGGEAMPMDPSRMQQMGAGPSLGAPAQMPPGGMVPPVDPSQVVGQGNTFGEQTGQEQPYHKGTDFQAVQGTPALSPVNGMVIFAGDRGDLGLSVIVLDDAGQSHEENHLSKIDVQMGDQVKMGQTLGSVGSTGNSTGAHLDYRVRQPNGDFANPESLPPVAGALAGKQDMSGASPQQIMEEMPGMPGEVPGENESGEMGMGGGEGWRMVGSGGMMTSEGWREDLADTPENQASYGGSRPGDDGVATPAPDPGQHYAPGADVDYTGWNQDEWRAGGNGWGTGPAQPGMQADPNHYAPDQADWTGWDWKGWQDAAAAGKPAASAAMPVARPAAAPAGTSGWPGVDQATHDMFTNTYGSEEAGKAAWQWEHDNPGAGSYYTTNHWLDRAQTPAPAVPSSPQVASNPQTASVIQASGWDALDPETKALFEGTYPGHGREAWEYQNAHPGEPYTGQNLTTANAQPKPGDPGTSTSTQLTDKGQVQVVRDQYGNEFWYQNGKLVYSRPAYDPTQLNAQTAATLQIQQQQLQAQAAQQQAQLDAAYHTAELNAKSAQELANIRIEYQKQKDAIDAQLQRESNALAERLGMAGYQRDLGVAATNAQGNVLSTWGAAAARSPWLARMSGRTPMAGDAGSRAAGDTSLIPGQSAQSAALLNTITNQNQADQGAFDQWQDYTTGGQYSGGSLGWGGGESLQDGMGWTPTNGLMPPPLPQDASWHDVGVGGADDALNGGMTTTVGTTPVVPSTPTPGIDSTPNTSGSMSTQSTQGSSAAAPSTTAGGFGTTSMADSGLPVAQPAATAIPAPAPQSTQAPTFTGPAGNQITLPTPQEYEAMGPYERAALRYGLESAGIPWEQVTDAMLGGWRDLGLSTASGLSGYGPQHRSNLGYDLMDPTQREDAWQMGELFMPQADYQERETRWNQPTIGRTAVRA